MMTENINSAWLRGCLRTKWNIFNSVQGQSLTAVYMKNPELKLIADVFSLGLFWWKWSFILGEKCCENTAWNEIIHKKIFAHANIA